MPYISPIKYIYLITKHGVPIFAASTDSSGDRGVADQESMHCGFLVAIQQFAQEAFQQKYMDFISMETLKVHLETDPHLGIQLAVVMDRDADDATVRFQMRDIFNLIRQKYPWIETRGTSPPEGFFSEFSRDLVLTGIIPRAELTPIQQDECKSTEIFKDTGEYEDR